jgi:DHA1 family bicyclomycin/chloramphenicol resistance-like MFS transporter
MLSFATILYVSFWHNHNALFITIAFIIFVIGQIIPGNILYPLYLNLMPDAKGRLTAIIQGGRLIFASIGLQIAGFFYDNSFQHIGIIVSCIILMGIIMLMYLITQWHLINHTHPA